jgi:hypothetical protein
VRLNEGLGLGRNKKLRSRLKGLQKQIAEHQAKMEEEWKRFSPSPDVIAGWKREIAGWKKEAERILRRLRREW